VVSEASESEESESVFEAVAVAVVVSLFVSMDDRIESIGVASVVADAMVVVVAEELDGELPPDCALTL
jgi:hypothetical protein